MMPINRTKEEIVAAVSQSYSYTEVLRKLKKSPSGSAHIAIKLEIECLGMSVSHFDRYRSFRDEKGHFLIGAPALPLSEVMTEASTYSRGALKARLYKEGLKTPICEICGQDENWKGVKIALILDHINGVRNDHRLENLRIVCPNCNAGLPTHCGRKHPVGWVKPESERIDKRIGNHKPILTTRKIERPPYEQLLQEIRDLGYVGTGRRYGVTDNSIRKWVRNYEGSYTTTSHNPDIETHTSS